MLLPSQQPSGALPPVHYPSNTLLPAQPSPGQESMHCLARVATEAAAGTLPDTEVSKPLCPEGMVKAISGCLLQVLTLHGPCAPSEDDLRLMAMSAVGFLFITGRQYTATRAVPCAQSVLDEMQGCEQSLQGDHITNQEGSAAGSVFYSASHSEETSETCHHC
ncbi:hypothetical protein Micbo1qcDRAFT_169591 [Microdochium bolleyi]|uniref:Uncharacterized protein n=1 Tax=Microdochium bolleyi TaxID=196109 RepID=A0A136IJR4_9PEZI|nr:hypothetical protein Micbo1qcDRAFT_169591 [Microdochium bolleyi]